MKFIYARNLEIPEGILPVMHGEAALFARKYGRSKVVSQLGTYNANDNRSVRLFDGFVTIAGKLYHPLITGSACPPIYSHSARHIDSGAYCVAEIRSDSLAGATAYFFNDPLSQYALYYYTSGSGTYAVSNCINTLKRILASNGIAAPTSFMPSVHNILFGGPFSDDTHYSGIRQIPFNTAIVATKDIVLLNYNWSQLSSDYRDAREQAHESLIRHFLGIRSSLKDNTKIVADVTGGADSRALLSYLMRRDLEFSFSGRCLTPAPHPDGQAASHIMDKYKIPIGSLPSGNLRHEAALRINAAMFGGGRDIGGGLTSNLVFPNLVHVRGMFGGLSGATPGADILNVLLKNNTYSDALLLEHVIARRTSLGVASLLHRDSLERAKSDYLALIARLREEFSKESMLPELYLRTRSRSHFGHLGRVDNWAKISPDAFCNSWLIEARNHLPSRLSSKAKLNFDLTVANNVDLAFEPMANKIWDKDLVPEEYWDRLSSMTKITSSTPFESSRVKELMVRKGFSSEKPDYIFTNLSSAGINRGPHDVYIPLFQAAAKLCVDSFAEEAEFWKYYDREAVISFMEREPEGFKSHGLEIQALGSVAAAGMSSLDLGIVPDLNEVNWT